MLPKDKRDCPFDEADKLRTVFVLMCVLHVGFILADIFIYGHLFGIIWEVLLLYVAYYCYMRLTGVAIYGYMALLVLCAFVGVLSFTVWFSSILSIFIYPIHLGTYVLAAYYIWKQK